MVSACKVSSQPERDVPWRRPKHPIRFTALTSACKKGSQLERSLEFFLAMVTRSARVSACGKGQELRRPLNVCAEMRRQAQEPDMVTYSALINACGGGQKLHGAFDV